MSVRSYRLIIVEDSLALAAYYILRKLLEVKAKKNFHLQLMNARVYNRIELTVRTFKFSFPSISYHQFGASQSKNFMANSKPRKQAYKANKTPVINCVQQKVSSS